MTPLAHFSDVRLGFCSVGRSSALENHDEFEVEHLWLPVASYVTQIDEDSERSNSNQHASRLQTG